MKAVQIASKTLAAIESTIAGDQGASYRQALQRVLPHIGDAYRGVDSPFRTHLGASVIGDECARKIWYGFHWTTIPSFGGRILRLFNRGHLEEGRFIAALLAIGCQVYQQDENGKQFRISGVSGHFGGSGDGIATGVPDVDPSLPVLLEFKTHNDKSYIKLAKEGVRSAKFEHYVQMQIYLRKMALTVALYMAVNKIIFAGIASAAKNPKLFGWVDLVIIDEAHLVSPSEETMYRKFLDALLAINPHLKVIGTTATPWRLGHGPIVEDGIFTDICFDLTSLSEFNKLIQEGYLLPLIPKQTKQMLDTSGVHMRGGEFISSELQAAVDKQEVTFAAVKELVEEGADRKHWLVFATGIQHAINISEMLESFGITSVVVHSNLTKQQRDTALEKFKNGEYQAAVNVGILTTGFDFPGIDLIAVLRPTASTVLWVQMLGRGTRPLYASGFDLLAEEGRLASIAASEKQNTLVLDFAGNTARLGPINDPVIPRKKGKGSGEAPVKLCGACATYNHAGVTHCVTCGAEFTFQVKLKAHASTQELIKGDSPVVEVFKVDHVTYSIHRKVNKPDAMKVTYYCGLQCLTDYVCFEHEGFAQRKARQWWRERMDITMPLQTKDAMELASQIPEPTHLRVWINKKYPEILSSCFDGSGFNKSMAA